MFSEESGRKSDFRKDLQIPYITLSKEILRKEPDGLYEAAEENS